MDLNKLTEFANRLMKGGRGAGVGIGFLAAFGGAAYGLSHSMYTGVLTVLSTSFTCIRMITSSCDISRSKIHNVKQSLVKVPAYSRVCVSGIRLWSVGLF